ncbi:FKBP-type peptidyl-prolyl cis-trans isomerase [Thalassoroseus pseudoceratinae]|uniref:FKBP-type peptidyl-prolyl cis-trans isomerase n=1 Tax=Thalassoroseus pseudoceratinae TaxID=2713176 RepID=UPI00141FBD2F|nr:FKBP-type peptidyl-prolyl cis-trans isomerase [Thalassoroseus pseudoceratinae]
MLLRTLMVVAVAVGCFAQLGCAKPDSRQTADNADPASRTTPSRLGPDGPDAQKEFTKTPTGLKYRVLRKGDGRTPTAQDTVLADYKGWLDDGTVFDSSYRRAEPIAFPLSGVVKGWTEGLQHVREGGKIELEIPSELGYGADPPPGIPPNATLHFIVELREVK